MIDAAQRSDRQLLTGHILRFETMYRQLHQQIRAGELGRPVSIHTRRNRPGDLVARYRARTHPVLETGVLDIDIMLWLTQSRVERVTSVTRTVVPGQNPDLVWGILEFADGCVGVLETHWLGPTTGIFTDDAINVIGTTGTARLDLSRAPLAVWNASGFTVPDAQYSPILGGEVLGAFREQLVTFVSALRSGHGTDLVPLDDVLHGLTVALALIRSSEEGKAVEISAFRPN
jgi:predicted dehydrogenase